MTKKRKKTKVAKSKKAPVQKIEQPSQSFLTRLLRTVRFAKMYAAVGVLALLATTLLWSWLGASTHGSNADQLVDVYLFQDWETFQGASFPSAHTFLLKWPLFMLINHYGASSAVFVAFTVLVSLVTVSAFAYLLYRIDRRPVVFGTLCLALASVLLLVPAQPYAGGILPVNMAMIATRNLEYVLYMASLVLLIRATKIRSWRFWLGTIGLTILAASDKLFLSYMLGGAVLTYVVALALHRRFLVQLALRWLAAGVLAFAGTALFVWFVNTLGVTHIAGETSPYGVAHGLKGVVLGCIFGFLGVLTNFGANPAFDAAVLRTIPHLLAERLRGPEGVAYVVNVALFVSGLFMTARLALVQFRARHKDTPEHPAIMLTVMLAGSSVVAIGSFVATHHYYVVDARYLTIILFTIFVASATFLRGRRSIRRRWFVAIAVLLLVSIGFGLNAAVQIHRAELVALAEVDRRNDLVSQALKTHPVDTVVGDYWRVVPLKARGNPSLTVTPLDQCLLPRDVLSSKRWQPDLNDHRFAYLLSFEKSLTNYAPCSLEEIITAFGRPNQTTLIAGSLEHPKEMLLFYDHGIQKKAPQTPVTSQDLTSIFPISLDKLTHTACPEPKTVMQVVAHEDDDLLFMNPDLLHDMKAGNCIRTIYVTAGDAGEDQLYWQARERGSQLAYASLLGLSADTVWVQRTVKVSDKVFVIIANPRGNTKISLIFLRLPDGNVNGQGFKSTKHESLAHLEAGNIGRVHAADGQSVYESEQIVTTIEALISTYKPTEIRTQAPYDAGHIYHDHSDHMATGRYVEQAYRRSVHSATLQYYIGYPIHELPENVTGLDLREKTAAFLSYATLDGAVCHTQEQCYLITSSYGVYLKRQYVVQP